MLDSFFGIFLAIELREHGFLCFLNTNKEYNFNEVFLWQLRMTDFGSYCKKMI